MNSMTLAISRDNAARMLEASRSLNAQLVNLLKRQQSQQQHTETMNESAGKSDLVTDPKDSGSLRIDLKGNESFCVSNLLTAVENTQNPLLTEFLNQMKVSVAAGVFSREEMMTCLLVFLDVAGKSQKLLFAFEQLAPMNKSLSEDQGLHNKENMIQKELSLDQEGIVKLFHCFLLSISTCIHYEDGTDCALPQDEDATSTTCCDKGIENELRVSCSDTAKVSVSPELQQDPNKTHYRCRRHPGWTLSDHVRRDILEISNYATSKLMQYIEESSKDEAGRLNSKASDDTVKKTTEPGDDTYVKGSVVSSSATKKARIRVSFQQFGEWYNKGGFSLVPWLELLDLNKWQVAGSAVRQAKAVKAVQEKQLESTLSDKNVLVTTEDPPSKEPSVSPNKMVANHTEQNTSSSSGSSSVPNNQGMECHGQSHPSEKDEPMEPTGAELITTHSDSGTGVKPVSKEYVEQQPEPVAPIQNQTSLPPTQDLPPQSIRYVFTCEFGENKEFRLHLSDESLLMFEDLVQKTGLNLSSPTHVSSILHRHVKPGNGIYQGISVIHRQDLPNVVRDLVPSPTSTVFTKEEMERFSTYFTIFFLSFARNANEINVQSGAEQVIAKELAVGFSFLCAGNKSQKLDETFKIMSDNGSNILTQHKLSRFIRSYLRMILGMSFLSKSSHVNKHHCNALLGMNTASAHVSSLCYTTEVGSSWILNNFIKYWSVKNGGTKSGMEKINFHDFADWYQNGGFNIAPWFELLDLSKLKGLIVQDIPSNVQPIIKSGSDPTRLELTSPKKGVLDFSPTGQPLNPPTSTGKIRSFDEFVNRSTSPNRKKKKTCSPNPQQQFNPDLKDILSTFPLSDDRSLIVLREDAAYVRSVVEQFGLLNSTPDSVWNKLFLHSKKNVPKPLPQRPASVDKSDKKSAELDQKTFVEGVLKSIPPKLRKKKSQPPLAPTPKDTLANFFLSFDMNQVNRVAANQLMGGFSLFCSGSKTVKLSFIFSLFDDSTEDDKKKKKSDSIPSLSGKEVFYFFRSILIVLFSCCKQSLMLTAGPVGTYIADAANKVTNDVMRYQWKTRKVDKINFDEFGEWYNKGGYEIAPWIELLDLEKWAFLDKDKAEKMLKSSKPDLDRQLKDNTHNLQNKIQSTQTPDKRVARSFFSPRVSHDDGFDPFGPDIGDMGDIGDIDCFDVDFGFDILPKVSDATTNEQLGTAASTSPATAYCALADNECISSYPYQFKLSIDEKTHRIASVPPRRVQLLKTLLIESGLNEMNICTMCNHIFTVANGYTISRTQFDSAVNAILSNDIGKNMAAKSKELCYSLFRSIFDQMVNFDGTAVTSELVCGLMVLCKGRKSEKLEFAFDILDAKKNGRFCRSQMISFLRSFLTVIFFISSCELGNEPAQNILLPIGNSFDDHLEDMNIIMKVSDWVTDSIFKATLDTILDGTTEHTINFDDFADWYTKGGHETNNWLELLDMEKWILSF
jgi:Ca2+-binding EF-hand superfamily protein